MILPFFFAIFLRVFSRLFGMVLCVMGWVDVVEVSTFHKHFLSQWEKFIRSRPVWAVGQAANWRAQKWSLPGQSVLDAKESAQHAYSISNSQLPCQQFQQPFSAY